MKFVITAGSSNLNLCPTIRVVLERFGHQCDILPAEGQETVPERTGRDVAIESLTGLPVPESSRISTDRIRRVRSADCLIALPDQFSINQSVYYEIAVADYSGHPVLFVGRQLMAHLCPAKLFNHDTIESLLETLSDPASLLKLEAASRFGEKIAGIVKRK